ncbi:hypothetical protein [Halomonas sp. C05BenzN]|uniref:hypothetical protein n=1 Tax=Halomonas sp. C05BenzN TaxID=3411041 RepID=UPI003B947D69
MLGVFISGHGLGHLSQVSAVLDELYFMSPDLSLTVFTPLPYPVLEDWINIPFHHVYGEHDVGMRMRDALNVDWSASLCSYRELHRGWNSRIDNLSQDLVDYNISLVLSDVPYLPLAAAQEVGIPSVAMCSLNWADVIHHYFPRQKLWIDMVRRIYQGANEFLVPEPGMVMPWLNNIKRIGPVGRMGCDRNIQLKKYLDIEETSCLILVGMGGFDQPLNLARWPQQWHGREVYYLIPEISHGQIPNSFIAQDLPFLYVDLIATCEILITKPGYGMFVEAAAAGTSILYVERSGWPDVTSLTTWVHRVANAVKISRSVLDEGLFLNYADELIEVIKNPPVALTGAAQAASALNRYL